MKNTEFVAHNRLVVQNQQNTTCNFVYKCSFHLAFFLVQL